MAVNYGEFVKKRTLDAIYLLATGAPLNVFLSLIKTRLGYMMDRKFYESIKEQVRNLSLANGEYSTEWFAASAPYWVKAFHRYEFSDRPISALEIGSWEGRSAVFLLEHLPNARLTAVDTWADSNTYISERMAEIERRFDANLARFADRLNKYKGTSFSYFLKTEKEEKFDLIYIDGSHRSDDVIVDAVLAFGRLTKGGILIFDDYLWRQFSNNNDNPAAAINAFLRMRRGEYEISFAYHQMIIRKTTD